jgi:hypothetical protein
MPEASPQQAVPDAIEPITAFRVWRVNEDLELQSLGSDTSWPPGGWLTARCERKQHSAPHWGCSCGLYSAKEINTVLMLASIHMPQDLAGPMIVLGRVHLSGKVIEHDDGYRAERARVIQILPVSGSRSHAEAVAARYGVPVGDEIPAVAIPLRPPLRPCAAVCLYTGPVEPPEPTIRGRLLLLAVSLFVAVNAVRGILWETHRLEWSDWWLCLVAVAGAIGVWRAIVMLPRALRGPPASGHEPSTESLDERTAVVPDSPRPHGGERL